MEKRAPPFCQFFWFGRTKKNIYGFVELLSFCFVLVHTRVRRVTNYYIIMYTTKKHHFTLMYVLNYLTGILSFFFV